MINDGDSVYLERYYLFTLLGWRFYIHRFVGSDPDRGLHDHPWQRAFSIILAGWYWEETRRKFGKGQLRKVRWYNSLTGDTFHRVVLPYTVEPHEWYATQKHCWTLFFHTADDVKEWGFLRQMGDPYDAQIFTPYTYAREGKKAEWWKTSKTRKQVEAIQRIHNNFKGGKP